MASAPDGGHSPTSTASTVDERWLSVPTAWVSHVSPARENTLIERCPDSSAPTDTWICTDSSTGNTNGATTVSSSTQSKSTSSAARNASSTNAAGDRTVAS